MTLWIKVAALPAVLSAVSGCAVMPLEDAAESAAKRVEERTNLEPGWPTDDDGVEADPKIREPLTFQDALALAFARNAEIRRQYARLGISHADLMDAARIANPRLSLEWLDPDHGGRDQTTRRISAGFRDLLLLPSRRRLSTAEFRRVELTVAGALLALAREVETAWYAHVGALQIVAMREAVAHAAETEEALARRYHEAGNIPRLQVDLRAAASARARIEALRARSEAAESRERLANLLGLRSEAAWKTVDRLPEPPVAPLLRDELLRQARAERLDLAAAREEVALLEDALGVTRRWRLLGDVEAGYERERETDGATLRGPTLALEVPLFNQGQGAVERAESRLLDARARHDALALAMENEIVGSVERLELARQATERFRVALLPSAASVVARQQEQVNFMLESPFELIRAKRDEYDAWQDYLESVRDYWIARAGLRAAAGGRLPGDENRQPPVIGVEEIIAPPVDQDKAGHEHAGEPP